MVNKENKKIKVVKGNGELNISKVKSNLDIEKPKKKVPQKDIIIPKGND